MKKILFVTYGGGHAQALLPLVEGLKAFYEVSVLALTTAFQIFNGEGYDVLSYSTLSHLEAENFIDYGESLIHGKDKSSQVSRAESIAYHGINYLDLIDAYGIDGAAEKYELLGRQCFLPLNFMTRVLKHLDPDLVVATSSPRSERAVLEAARNLKVKSLCLVDLYALQEKEWVGTTGYATRVCVLNEFVKNLLVHEGRNSHEIVVTGNPAFDKLLDEDVLESSKTYKSKISTTDKNILFWASQPEPEIHPFTKQTGGDPELPLKIERKLRDFVEDNNDWVLIIRAHPSENREPETSPGKVFWSKPDERMTDALIACDCLVTIASTIALEAHLIGKPVITVDMSIFTADAPFSDMGISTGVNDLGELTTAIRSSVEKKLEFDEESSRLNAAKNVINVIHEMLSE